MNAHKTDKLLFDEALRQQARAHAPYSNYKVGVVLETLSGELISGCNIECVDYLGLEAAEVALARLVTKHDWRENVETVRLSRAIFAVPRIDRESNSFMPSPQSLGRLRFFSHFDIPLLFIDESGAEEGYMLERLLPLCPNIDSALQLFQQKGLKAAPALADLAATLQSEVIASTLIDKQKHCMAPASDYCVTCVLVSDKGDIYSGCNIETSMHCAIHAEESAIANMVASEGGSARIKDVYVLVAGNSPAWPCGNCRQKLMEFSDETTKVTVIDQSLRTHHETLYDLLPHGFRASDLNASR